uniref:RING-type domain-containing protein n=1 Tax=Astatotilapia calliptera TaxID=8154 RepID=A0A3P8RD96_ASTCA
EGGEPGLTVLPEDLCCPACQEVFRDPVLLSCSHSFCKDCLKRWWRERTTRLGSLLKTHQAQIQTHR